LYVLCVVDLWVSGQCVCAAGSVHAADIVNTVVGSMCAFVCAVATPAATSGQQVLLAGVLQSLFALSSHMLRTVSVLQGMLLATGQLP
jgi:NaMN:DMB phosphoribosyltransferase